jgi:hypothetical protein
MLDPLFQQGYIYPEQGVESESAFSAETVARADTNELKPILPVSPIKPGPIVTLALRNTSGRYRGKLGNYELELRVDVDGAHPCNMISGDFYQVSGSVKTYFGSFKSASLIITKTSALITLKGTVTTSWTTSFNIFTVTIPRVYLFIPPASATIAWSNAGGTTGTTYVCPFELVYFRTVGLEEDYEQGTSLFGQYNTGLLPHGGTARVLDVFSAYAEAGIQMVATGGSDMVPTVEAGADAVWTNAELEAAMHKHFSLVKDVAQWQDWLFACKSRHEFTSGGSVLFGIMFDYTGTCQRQGCAVFQTQINSYYGGAGSNDANRHLLYCYVHELGHTFNMLHSWDKGRPNALSWMNYDWKYDQLHTPGSFWANFAFIFDDLELVHIRHGFRKNVIMGGDAFNVNPGFSTDEVRLDITSQVIENRSGLALEMDAKPVFALGEPVVVNLRLVLRDLNGKMVNAWLHPNFDLTKIAIRKPNNSVVVYRPLAEHLCAPNMQDLSQTNPSISDSAYIGYGKDGYYFDQPGIYVLRAGYHTPEGGVITSGDIQIRVRSPLSEDEDQIADLYMGDEQGKLFYLLGSDSPFLKKGNDALQTVLEKYPANPLSVYAALVKGVNAARDFKMIGPDKQVTVRRSDPNQSSALINKVFEASNKGAGVDYITLNFAMRKSAESQLKSGDKKAARRTADEMKAFLGKQNLAEHELNLASLKMDSLFQKP